MQPRRGTAELCQKCISSVLPRIYEKGPHVHHREKRMEVMSLRPQTCVEGNRPVLIATEKGKTPH